MQSDSSVIPSAARWRVPSSVASSGLVVKGRKAGRGCNPVALNDHCPVVQRAARLKNSAQQIARNVGIQIDAAFNKGTQADFPFQYDERADLTLRQLIDGQDNLLRQFAALQLTDSQEGTAAQPGQHAAQFRLKHHDQRDGGIGRQCRQNGTQQFQSQKNCSEIGESEDAYSEQDEDGAASANNLEKLINQDRDNEDINGGCDGEPGQHGERG